MAQAIHLDDTIHRVLNMQLFVLCGAKVHYVVRPGLKVHKARHERFEAQIAQTRAERSKAAGCVWCAGTCLEGVLRSRPRACFLSLALYIARLVELLLTE